MASLVTESRNAWWKEIMEEDLFARDEWVKLFKSVPYADQALYERMRLPLEHKPVTDKELGDFIREVAKTIEQYGWVRCAPGDEVHGFCVIGAMNHINRANMRQPDRRFLAWLQERGEKFLSIPAWNDAPGRTKEEVLLNLYKFAEELSPLEPQL